MNKFNKNRFKKLKITKFINKEYFKMKLIKFNKEYRLRSINKTINKYFKLNKT